LLFGCLLACTGEFEERLKAVLKEITESGGNVVTFIDEIHSVVGAGATSGAMDASNLLKPMLARGELRCIGATTLAEYKQYIEKVCSLCAVLLYYYGSQCKRMRFERMRMCNALATLQDLSAPFCKIAVP
jgi:ATPase family associated with various cellular activities (AAA)